MKILLLRSPRYYWPFINEYDNFLLPQSLPCLAAALREHGFTVKVIDCMPMKIGWQSLHNLIQEEKPDIVGVGDSESLYSKEVIRTLQLVKTISPRIITVVGGAHFSNLAEESLGQYPIDFIVKGEGESTLVELVKELGQVKPALGKVKGIVFKEGDNIVETTPQPLIQNLDDLPLPAYDLMPMNDYGKARFLFSPGGITIHHSRGCISNCEFCVWWTQMGERKVENGKVKVSPRWRTKSVERTLEEIELLYYKYNKKFLIFVDDSWNIDPAWNERFADAVLKKNLPIQWFAFMRADFIIRDEKLKIMGKLVKAGLRHVSMGVERAATEDLKLMGKKCYTTDIVKEAMSILRNKYPQVFRQATFIVGIRNETKESMLSQLKYAQEMRVDYPAFHPITPVPGTELWNKAKQQGWLEVTDFSYYDWSTPVMSSKHLSRYQIDELIYILNKEYARISWLLKGLFSRHAYRRNIYIWWVLVAAKMFWDSLLNLVNPFRFKDYTQLIKPKWYDK